MASSELHIFLHRMLENRMRLLKNYPEACTFLVLKANAYGLGAIEIARYFEQLSIAAVDGVCVATLEEGLLLREAGIHLPIHCLGCIPEEQMESAYRANIRPTLSTMAQAQRWKGLAKEKKEILPVEIALDTGHSRIGFQWDHPEQMEEVEEILQWNELLVAGIFSHFSCADELLSSFTNEQNLRFWTLVQSWRAKGIFEGVAHIANDAALMRDLVQPLEAARLGIGIYGGMPSPEMQEVDGVEILPTLSWRARITQIKEIKAGVGVSYGQTWTAPRKTKLATIQVGYADGYPRSLSNRGFVYVKGFRCPIRGRICMDQCMVDITDLPISIKEGDWVYLLGADPSEDLSNAVDMPIRLQELAQWSDRIVYEILTGISARVTRCYEEGIC